MHTPDYVYKFRCIILGKERIHKPDFVYKTYTGFRIELENTNRISYRNLGIWMGGCSEC